MKMIAKIIILLCLSSFTTIYAKDLTESQKKIKEINKQIRKDPFESEYYYQLADIYVKDKNYRSAEYEIKKAYKMHPKDKYRMLLGELYLIQEKADDVIALFPETALINDNSFEKLLMIAKAHRLREEYGRALETYQKALKIRPNDREVIMGQARVYIDSNKPKKAKDFLKELAKTFKDDPKLWLLTADYYLSEEYYDHAIGYYKKVIEKTPKVYDAYLGYAKAAMEKKDFKMVLKYGLKMMELQPQKPMGRYYAAKGAFETGDINKAYYLYANVPSNSPDLSYPKGYLVRAEIQMVLGMVVTAQELLKQYLSYYSYDEKALEYIAQIKLHEESFHQALRDYEMIYKQNPFNLNAYNGMISAFIQTENHDLLPKWIDKTLKQFSLPHETAYPLTVAKFVCGYRLATANCKSAQSKDLAAQLLKVVDSFYYGRQDRAEETLNLLSEKFPEYADIWALKALMELRKEKEVRAYDYYTKALLLDARNRQALEGMEILYNMPQMRKRVLEFLWKYYDKTKTGDLLGTWLKLSYNPKKIETLRTEIAPFLKQEIHSYDFWYIASSLTDGKEEKYSYLVNAAKEVRNDIEFRLLRGQLPQGKTMRKIFDAYEATHADINYDAVLDIANYDIQIDNYTDAEFYLNKLIKKEPNNGKAYDSMARIMFLRGEMNRLQTYLITHSELFDYGKKTSLKAWMLYKSNMTKEAILYLTEQYNSTKNNEILLTLYEIQKRESSEKKAIEILETYPDSTQYAPIAIMLSNYYMKDKQYEKAERLLRTIKDTQQNDTDFLSLYAMARHHIGEADGFIYAKKLIEYDSGNKKYNRIYGLTAFDYGEYDIAVEALKTAKDDFPKDELIAKKYSLALKEQEAMKKKEALAKEAEKSNKEKAKKKKKLHEKSQDAKESWWDWFVNGKEKNE